MKKVNVKDEWNRLWTAFKSNKDPQTLSSFERSSKITRKERFDGHESAL